MKLFAIWFGKLALIATRVTGAGSGTTFPGLLAEKIDHNIIKKLATKIKYGAIIITGTNGKTTTAKMLVEILSEDGYTVLHNPSGSNLTRGIASALIQSANIFGTKIHADIAVFEIDEATMPEATTKIRPRAVLVTNLFRDQLDRYGELDKTAAIVGSSLRGFPMMTTILNADDPLVSSLAKYVEGPVKYFGVEDKNINTSSTAAMDSKDCTECGHELIYENRYFGHLGVWKCSNCEQKRSKLDFSVSEIDIKPKNSKFKLNLSKESLPVEMQISGLYNIYNAVSAASGAEVLDAGGAAVSSALRNFSAAFGRMETFTLKGKEVTLLLVKNPTGANQALDAVFSDKKTKTIMLALNDNFADGTDISWIWDVDFESLNLSGSNFVVSGIRAEDMALRLKYAGVGAKQIILEKNIIEAVNKTVEIAGSGDGCYIFPTYTAMMEVRSVFADKSDSLSELGKVTKHGI
jgi:UDP-N-acetylmuramyl tripeptide synthase